MAEPEYDDVGKLLEHAGLGSFAYLDLGHRHRRDEGVQAAPARSDDPLPQSPAPAVPTVAPRRAITPIPAATPSAGTIGEIFSRLSTPEQAAIKLRLALPTAQMPMAEPAAKSDPTLSGVFARLHRE
jgi:hypothetical protein